MRLLVLLALALLGPPTVVAKGWADDASTMSTCQLGTIPPAVFPTMVGGNVTVQTVTLNVPIQCSAGVAWALGVADRGLNPISTNNRMKHTTANLFIVYQVRRTSDNASMQPGGTNSVTGTGNDSWQTAGISLRHTTGQTARAGTYTDTITLSLVF
jgi:spore coat protein U-like protein